MGLFMADAPLNLQPVHPPLGLNPNYTNHPLVTLVLKEKVFSWTGDDFTVTDTSGRPVVKCSGKVMSMRGRKSILDPWGNYLFTVREKMLAFRTTFRGEDQGGNELFEVKNRMSLGSKMTVKFTNASTGQPVTLVLKGDMFGRSATIVVEGGPPVAQIKRKSINARNLIMDKQTYFVDVAPGVDLALIAAVCICLDEIENDSGSGNAADIFNA